MSIEKECKKIHKKIKKFYEKYKNKRNICLNLKCDKENGSYNICLYVNPQIQENKVMIENLKLDNIWFSQRKELENRYKKWIKENKVADSIFNVISFLEGYNLLNRKNVNKFLKEKNNGNKF